MDVRVAARRLYLFAIFCPLCYNEFMKCFVIAMQKEADPVICSAEHIFSDRYEYGLHIIECDLYGERVAAVICGVGKVNAARGAQYAIDRLGADYIVNIGVAGGLSPDLKVAGIYSVGEAVQYDFDLTQLNGTQIGTLDEYDFNYFPLIAHDIYPRKRVGTGDRFNDSESDYKLLTSVLGADIRDMELGAIAQVCRHAHIKCSAFKIISDLAGSGSTTEQYLRNLKRCSETLAAELSKISEALNG